MMTRHPGKHIQAADMGHLIDQVTHCTMEHGESRHASVRCLVPDKPSGFRCASEDLCFNLVVRTAEIRGNAAA